MADIIALTVRFLHITFGIMWVGAIMYGVVVIRIALGRVDMAARKETMKHLIPVVTRYVPGSAVMTILMGAVLYLYMGGFDTDVLFGSDWGRVLLSTLVLALVAFGIGMVFGVGSAKKVLAHLQEAACTHGREVGALQKRFNLAQFVVLGLGLWIIALMVVATRGI